MTYEKQSVTALQIKILIEETNYIYRYCYYARGSNNFFCYLSYMIIPSQTFINYYTKKVCTFNLFNVFPIYGNFNIILWFLLADLNRINFVLVILRDNLLTFSHSAT